MFTVAINANIVLAAELAKLAGFDAVQVCKAQAVDTLEKMRKRIHQEGRASDGSKIGTYSAGYMKVRTGNYGNSGTYARGSKAGQAKDSGAYTRGKNKGAQRPKYNRTSDTTVVSSLTRQQEQDMSVLPIPNGFGVGYTNPLNMQKVQWVEANYKRRIFSPTSDEQASARQIAEEAIEKYLR